MARLTIPYGEVANGDRLYLCGYLFEVCNVRTVSAWMDGGQYGPGVPVVRFQGRVVGDADIKGTGYDGGTYGGRFNLQVVVERGGQ